MKILGTGSALAGQCVSNEAISQLVDTNDAWIQERTGIETRYIAGEESASDLAYEAGALALKDAGRNALEIEMILVATCSAERIIPSVSCQIQERLGARNAVCMDLNAACAGFLYALNTAWAFMKAGQYRKILIVGTEILSRILDWNDRGTCILFGDGAGAAYVEYDETLEEPVFVLHSDGTKGSVLLRDFPTVETPFGAVDKHDPFLKMDGREVFGFAVRKVPAVIDEALTLAKVEKAQVSLFVLHQANLRIIEQVSRRMEVGMEQFPVNVNRVGNMSSASIPVLLDELKKSDRLERGQKLVLAGFGAGLNYGAAVLTW